MDYAQTITQLGGHEFQAMTGATFSFDSKTEELRVKFRGCKKFNILYIKLNSLDTYDVRFCKYKELVLNHVSEYENIYSEDLRGLFERETGLRTSINQIFA